MQKTILLNLAVLLGIAAMANGGKYGGGTGEANDPYLIYDANQMNAIGADPNDWDEHFRLMADINLADYTGAEFNIIGNFDNPFAGVFDGNNHTLSNFTYQSISRPYYIGLFGCVSGPNAVIRDLTLVDPNVGREMGYYVGGLVGDLERGGVSGCRLAGGTISGDHAVGGLVGRNLRATISDCSGNGSVEGYDCAGGLVGDNVGAISKCYTSGKVFAHSGSGGLVGDHLARFVGISDCYSSASVSGHWCVGGLAGTSNRAIISNCYATGSVTGVEGTGGLVGDASSGALYNCHASGPVTGVNRTGGLVGWNDARVSSCYATGCVTGAYETGGLMGINHLGFGISISNCYALGPVDGNDRTGGLVGYNDGLVSNSYAAGAVDGNSNVGGFAGFHQGRYYTSCFWDSDVNPDVNGIGNAAEPNVIGESTTQMQRESTFTDVGWDFVEVWDIGENQTYPFLRQHAAGDINHDRRVDFLDFAIFASHWLQEWGQ